MNPISCPPIGEVACCRLDPLAALMACLVVYVGLVVMRFAGPYLAGDPRRARFFCWMSLTLGSVLALVLAGNLFLMLGAWIATSLCLHRLLLHYSDRPGAIFAARKKFVVSRLGDLCMLGATVLIYRHYHTGDLEVLFKAAAAGDREPLPSAGVLLVLCAALKSAQFPFHSWLPDTMETPTPVSAFMHAGIINAGGFLVVRLSPLLVWAPAALALLAVIGAVTAAFGSIVMLASPSVKRALAFSTIAQMGFMLMECGLGAFGLAVLHLVAHSLYKADAFLRSGSTVGATPRAAVALQPRALALGLAAAGLLMAGAVFTLAGIAPGTRRAPGVFDLILVLAIAYGLARAWSVSRTGLFTLGALAVAAGLVTVSLLLHLGARAAFGFIPAFAPPGGISLLAATVFVGLFLFQVLLWRWGRHALGRRLYVHALNGFYVSTYANRLLGRLWPKSAAPV